MQLISYRGNTVGRNLKLENSTAYINDAMLEGYAVVVDVWLVENELYLCSAAPSVRTQTTRSRGYRVGFPWEKVDELYLENDMILARARTPETLVRLAHNSYIHCFFLDGEAAVTSRGYVCTEKTMSGPNVICINPDDSVVGCYGVCSDNIREHGRPDADRAVKMPLEIKRLGEKRNRISLLASRHAELEDYLLHLKEKFATNLDVIEKLIEE